MYVYVYMYIYMYIIILIIQLEFLICKIERILFSSIFEEMKTLSFFFSFYLHMHLYICLPTKRTLTQLFINFF